MTSGDFGLNTLLLIYEQRVESLTRAEWLTCQEHCEWLEVRLSSKQKLKKGNSGLVVLRKCVKTK